MNLAPFYPLPPGGVPAAAVVGSLLLLTVVTGLLLAASRRWPYLAVGWLWYLVTLLPVSGVVQLGSYARADRYLYIPSIGLFVLLVWWLADVMPLLARIGLVAVAGVVILALTVATRQQVRCWRDSVALWEHALAMTPDNFVARTNLGMALAEAGRLDDADEQLAAAARSWPDLARAHDNLGLVRLQRDMVSQAISCFEKAVALEPGEPRYNGHLTQARERLGR